MPDIGRYERKRGWDEEVHERSNREWLARQQLVRHYRYIVETVLSIVTQEYPDDVVRGILDRDGELMDPTKPRNQPLIARQTTAFLERRIEMGPSRTELQAITALAQEFDLTPSQPVDISTAEWQMQCGTYIKPLEAAIPADDLLLLAIYTDSVGLSRKDAALIAPMVPGPSDLQ